MLRVVFMRLIWYAWYLWSVWIRGWLWNNVRAPGSYSIDTAEWEFSKRVITKYM